MTAMTDERTSAYESCPEVCRNLERPGLGHDAPQMIDFSKRHTTVDQLSIENALDAMDLGGRSILHVGVGNASLGLRFHRRTARIDGMTIAENEQVHALATGTYDKVFLINKYSRGMSCAVAGPYDFIVDNNLAGFACCRYHFYAMLDAYAAALADGGRVLTHERGMGWAYKDERWRLTVHDLVRLGDKFPFRTESLGDGVHALIRESRT
jgi:hypothetical protein